MNKVVVISTNDHVDYLHYLPIITHAWNQLGWKVVCFYRGAKTEIPYYESPNELVLINEPSDFREATIVQVSRLFSGCLNIDDETYVMTSDVDMLPCYDYWKPNEDEISIYGYDLTDFSEFPICYIGMKAKLWREIMGVEKGSNVMDVINSFLKELPNATSDEFEKWWGVDQQEITKRLMPKEVRHYNRMKIGDYAYGRVDRGDWNKTLTQSHYIDSHLPRPAKHQDSYDKVNDLLLRIGFKPEWYNQYTNE
jgi:hypothetical protein